MCKLCVHVPLLPFPATPEEFGMCGDPLPSDCAPWSRDCEGTGSGALHQNGTVHSEVCLGLVGCIVSY